MHFQQCIVKQPANVKFLNIYNYAHMLSHYEIFFGSRAACNDRFSRAVPRKANSMSALHARELGSFKRLLPSTPPGEIRCDEDGRWLRHHCRRPKLYKLREHSFSQPPQLGFGRSLQGPALYRRRHKGKVLRCHHRLLHESKSKSLLLGYCPNRLGHESQSITRSGV